MSEIRQIQVDGINYDLVISEDEVSATSAAESAAEALSYKNQASTSATNAATSAINAATSATNAANSAQEAIISARSAESAAYIAGGVSSITDPNEDGNLVVNPPNISDSGWAVRYDVDQTVFLSASDQARARKNIVAGGTNPNLLDNPWFIQASCVNQRSYTSSASTGEVDCVDRWKVNRATASVTLTGALSSQGLSLAWNGSTSSNGVLTQRVEKSKSNAYAGKEMTVSVLLADGTVHSGAFTWPASSSATVSFTSALSCTVWNNLDAYATLNIYNSSTTAIKIHAVKLELGSVSTLANDVPPEMAKEHDACLYYAEIVKNPHGSNKLSIGLGNSVGAGTIYLPIKLHPKRDISLSALPTPVLTGVIYYGEITYDYTTTGVTWYDFDPNSGYGTLAITGNAVDQYKVYRVSLDVGAKLLFSADL